MRHLAEQDPAPQPREQAAVLDVDTPEADEPEQSDEERQRERPRRESGGDPYRYAGARRVLATWFRFGASCDGECPLA
jgi:hypothetical protein